MAPIDGINWPCFTDLTKLNLKIPTKSRNISCFGRFVRYYGGIFTFSMFTVKPIVCSSFFYTWSPSTSIAHWDDLPLARLSEYSDIWSLDAWRWKIFSSYISIISYISLHYVMLTIIHWYFPGVIHSWRTDSSSSSTGVPKWNLKMSSHHVMSVSFIYLYFIIHLHIHRGVHKFMIL